MQAHPLAGFSRCWFTYWFRPAPLFDLAVFRLAVVGTQMFWLIWHGEYGLLMQNATMPAFLYKPFPILRLLHLGTDFRPSAEILTAIFALTLISGFLALIGWRTRLFVALFALGSLYITVFNFAFRTYHHEVGLVLIALLVLPFSPCGAALSVDRLRQNRPPNGENSVLAGWPLLLTRWLLSLVYLSAFLSKIFTPGTFLEWINGYTLQHYMLQDALRWNSDLGVFISQFHELAVALSVITLIFEGTFFLVLFFPRLTWVYIPAGIGFHLGIYLIQRAAFFPLIALYTAFISWSAGRIWWNQRFSRVTTQPSTVPGQ
jgi:hypothetical protein